MDIQHLSSTEQVGAGSSSISKCLLHSVGLNGHSHTVNKQLSGPTLEMQRNTTISVTDADPICLLK